ncbi:MAG: GntR family transcriptional regulator [Lachnospiraceae bacterium]|nr:GntR family transcriptional regulator [Lachnospiraceae bacterium]MDD3795858.1 GntR family transcriptional regulator [Lachnospiraceae bacterium]
MEFRSSIPLYVQVITDMKKKIINGHLPPGTKLPSTRELAQSYQINPNTAQRIYNEMETQGLTFTRRGIGTFVTEEAARLESLKSEMAGLLLRDLVRELKDIGFTKQELLDAVALSYEAEMISSRPPENQKQL